MAEGRDEATPAPRAGGSIRIRLLVLIAAIVIPAAIAFSLAIFDLYRHEKAAKEAQLLDTARAVSTAVDANLGQGWVLVETLARSDSLQRGDLAAFEAEARRAAQPGMTIMLGTAEGGQLINTRAPAGAALPTGVSAEDHARWSRLLSEHRIVSDLFTGRVVHRPTVALSLLVERPGRTPYELALLIDPEVEAQLLARQHLPKGWIIGLLDRNALVIARAPNMPGYVGLAGAGPVLKLVQAHRDAVTATVSRAGVPVIVAAARSTASNWTTTVAAPRAEFEAGLFRSLTQAMVIGAFFLIAGALLAVGLSQQVVTAVRRLTAQARAVGEMRPAAAVATGLAETDAVSQALSRAAAERDAHERSLADLNATLEVRVTEATEQLVQARKMEALGQLTGGVAHDFNNLLTAVLGNLSLLEASDLTERQRRWVAGAVEASERGGRLTGQLLAFARRQRLAPEAFDVSALLRGMESLLGSTLGNSVRVRIEAAEPAYCLADRTQLELAVVNLAINARDAMPDGGVLTLSAGIETLPEGRRADGAPPPGRYVVVTVADTGEGMSAEVQRRALEPFFTTKGPGRGSGLGLPQALGMATQLGGGLTIESARGRGSTIRIFLPTAEAPSSASAPEPVVRAGGETLGPLRLLLVDDDEAVRAATAGLLAGLGCQVTEAPDGPTALRAPIEAFDAVVADYAMPDMNGADLAEQLQARRPTLPVVILTGFADPDRLAAMWKGPVLTKPYDVRDLAAAIRDAIASKRVQQPS